ncbi:MULTISPECIES: hypothetical protein [Streptomyces]|uniref:hypothetical protein n=1 Tax=Streptomyces TaxID=1883 RepID=UPI00163B9DE3|nr:MULTISPECIES: hypothetical protein [Streptomyces]MBC2876602.1 hypothetical protein [Streptomyces sp. TYQ1024]UBI40729.1 hypothetical protein K7I03_32545 [Streptomyces mobaraensis]UKW33310.1 hypothetical protein MCU78_32470 [Streptomyces sp. TYQ1024]
MTDKDTPEHKTGKPRTAVEEAVKELGEITSRPDRRHERDAADGITPSTEAQESVQRAGRDGGGRPRKGH